MSATIRLNELLPSYPQNLGDQRNNGGVNRRRRGARRTPRQRQSRPQRARTAPSAPRRRRRVARRATQRSTEKSILQYVSAAGIGFLKDSFAPPDFPTSKSRGVPDTFIGKVLVKDHYYSGTTATGAATNDTVILVKPTPGEAYSIANAWPQNIPDPVAPVIFQPNGFNDSNQFFPGGYEAQNVNAFRYNSLCVEIVPLTSPLASQGSISVNKGVIRYDDATKVLNGTGMLSSLVNKAPYVQPSLAGCYSVATHKDSAWDFTTLENDWGSFPGPISPLPGELVSADNHNLVWTYVPALPGGISFTGVGAHESIAIRLSGWGANAQFSIRVWATVEYLVQENSSLAEYAHDSPAEDELALTAYKLMAQEMPIAVPHTQNASFWKVLLGIFSGGLSLLGSVVPGPWGVAAKAGSLFTGTLHGLIPG